MKYFADISPKVKVHLLHYGKKDLSTYPLYARVTYKRKKLELSLRIQANPSEWDFQNEMFLPTKKFSIFCNQKIGEFRLSVIDAFEALKKEPTAPTLKRIKEVLTGKEIKNSDMPFLKYYDQVVEQKKQQTSVYRASTINQYLRARNHLHSFLVRKGMTDIKLIELSRSFIIEFEHYLLSNKIESIGGPMMKSSMVTNIKRIKAIVNEAVRAEMLPKNPFDGYRVQHDKTQKISYLTSEQLKKIEDLDVSEYSGLVRAKEYFLFLCHSGLRFGDFQGLRCVDLEYSTDGLLWLSMEQQKTRGMLNFPLTPTARDIAIKYKGDRTGNQFVFPRITNQIFNKHLRTIKMSAGVKGKISSHTGRHTFSVQCLDRGLNIVVLQRFLGHKSISSTMIYGQISNKNLSESILLLS